MKIYKPNKIETIILATLLTVTLIMGGLLASRITINNAPAPATTEKSVAPKKEVPKPQKSLITLMNEFRAVNSLPALTEVPDLDASAQARANEIAACGKVCFEHDRPDGSAFETAIPAHYVGVGENLTECYGDHKDATNGWIKSPLHHDNMLGKLPGQGGADWTYVGVAESFDVAGKCKVAVMHFGR